MLYVSTNNLEESSVIHNMWYEGQRLILSEFTSFVFILSISNNIFLIVGHKPNKYIKPNNTVIL